MEYSEKFIAFVDVLGFKKMVEKSVAGDGMTLDELLVMLKHLKLEDEVHRIQKGTIFCPDSKRINDDLDFRITQISDCVVISSEKSPVGLLNLVIYCSNIVVNLLKIGKMCRGYISCGMIYHTDNQFVGTGYQQVIDMEKKVTVFKDKNEGGPPFIEIDPIVHDYMVTCKDSNIIRYYKREIKSDGIINAVFPFPLLVDKHIICGNGEISDVEQVIEAANKNSFTLKELQERVMEYVDMSDDSARKKAEHYTKALYDQLIHLKNKEMILKGLIGSN